MNLLKALLISFVFVGVVNAADPAASAKPAAASASAKPAAPATPIDINTADKAALSTLKGIGPAKAEAIIKYRQEKGGFKTIDDLKNVNGIGDKVFEAIKSDVTVGGGAKPADKPVEASAKPAEAKKSAAPAEAKPAEKASAKAEEKKPATPAPKM